MKSGTIPVDKVIDYWVSEDGKYISLRTHAAIDLDVIQAICAHEAFAIEYKDDSIDDLTATLDSINEKALALIKEKPELCNLPDDVDVTAKAFKKNYPLHALFWNRYSKGLDLSSVSHNGYEINYLHSNDVARDARFEVDDDKVKLVRAKSAISNRSWSKGQGPDLKKFVHAKHEQMPVQQGEEYHGTIKKPDIILRSQSMNKKNVVQQAKSSNEQQVAWKNNETMLLQEILNALIDNTGKAKIVVGMDVVLDKDGKKEIQLNKLQVKYKDTKYDLMDLLAKADFNDITFDNSRLDRYVNYLFNPNEVVWTPPSEVEQSHPKQGVKPFVFEKNCKFYIANNITLDDLTTKAEYKNAYAICKGSLYYVDMNNVVVKLKKDLSKNFINDLKAIAEKVEGSVVKENQMIMIPLNEGMDEGNKVRNITKLSNLIEHDALAAEMIAHFEKGYRDEMQAFDETHPGSRLHQAHFGELCAFNLYTYESFCSLSNALLRSRLSDSNLNDHLLPGKMSRIIEDEHSTDQEKQARLARFFQELLLGGMIAQAGVRKYAHKLEYAHRYERESEYVNLKKENKVFPEKTLMSASPGKSTFIEDKFSDPSIADDQGHMLVLFLNAWGVHFSPLTHARNQGKNENEFAVIGDSEYEEGRTVQRIKTLIRHPAGQVVRNEWSKTTKKEWKSVVEKLSQGFFDAHRSAYANYRDYLAMTLQQVDVLEKSLYPNVKELQQTEDRVLKIQSILSQHKNDLEQMYKSLEIPPREKVPSISKQNIEVTKNRREAILHDIKRIDASLLVAEKIIAKTQPMISGESLGKQVGYSVYGLHEKEAVAAYAGNDYSAAVVKKDELLQTTVTSPTAQMLSGDEQVLATSQNNTIVTLPINVMTADFERMNSVTIRTHDAEKKSAKSEIFLTQTDRDKFNNEARIETGYFTKTSIPGQASLEWAYRNINVFLAIKPPQDPINIKPDNLPHGCVEALILYCQYKKIRYTSVYPYNSSEFISEQQLKLFAKEWEKLHPEDKSTKGIAKTVNRADEAGMTFKKN